MSVTIKSPQEIELMREAGKKLQKCMSSWEKN